MKILKEATQTAEGIYNYIQDMKTIENDIASHVRYGGGDKYAHFWWNEDGYYTLVLQESSDSSTADDTKYWGDEELQDVNDIKLTAEQLYKELKALPGADLKNFYGMNNLFDEFGRERYSN